jgi:hypothetical protein
MTSTHNHLRTLEERLLNPAFRKDAAAVSALLADDFREFGSSGRIFNKQQIIVELAAEPPGRTISLEDFACQQIAPEAALITYRTTNPATDPPRTALRSSLWILRDNGWQILFHQGTLLPSQQSPAAL